MQYFSIDIETTGLNPATDQILQVGIVFEDTCNLLPFDDLPSIQFDVKHERIEGDPFAIQMNHAIIKNTCISNPIGEVIPSGNIWFCIAKFVRECLHKNMDDGSCRNTINVAGKNFNGFDRLFLNNVPDYNPDLLRIRHRVLDPAIMCVDWSQDRLPDLKQCLETAGVKKDVSHTAKDDALDVVKVIRIMTDEYEGI